MRIALAGPTSSGKTVYLASLLRADEFCGNESYAIQARPAHDNRAALDLDPVAVRLICGEPPMATDSITEYELRIGLPRSFVVRQLARLPLLKDLRGLDVAEESSLTFVDVPGGGCMPEPGKESAPAVVADLARADALLLLLPATGLQNGSMRDAESRLRTLVEQVRAARADEGLPNPRYGFERLCVTISMADVLVHGEGERALRKLDWMDPYRTVRERLGAGFVREVRRSVTPGGDAYALTSAFGFDRKTGAVAAQHAAGRWSLDLDEHTFRRWWPYRLFEPVEFLGRGILWRARVQ